MIIFKMVLAFGGCALVSFLLFYLVLKQKNSESLSVIQNKDKEGLKKLKQEIKSDQWTWQNLVMSKWIAFGGGFYGVMAVLTYLVVEFWEIVDFFSSENTLLATLASIQISDVVGLFINSLMNFIAAITWPVYWLNRLEGYSAWVWFVVVYFGYVTGQFIAKNMSNPYANINQK